MRCGQCVYSEGCRLLASHAQLLLHSSALGAVVVCWSVDSYGAKFVDEYVGHTVGNESLCIGEYWTDLAWNGSELEANQDAARQVGLQAGCAGFV